MRLLERDKRVLTIKSAVANTNKYNANERLYRFDGTSAQNIRAVVQPLTGHTAALVYGMEINKRKRLLYDGSVVLVLGMGVCVDVASTAQCDYRIEDLPGQQAGIQSAVLVYIPPEQRGSVT